MESLRGDSAGIGEFELDERYFGAKMVRGGCVAGGGQPYGATDAIREKRGAGLYHDDKQSALRCSHQNPAIQAAYQEFLGEPGGQKAHELLHTKYKALDLYAR